MLIQVTLSKLRRNLGDMVSYVNITENRLMILKHGVARAALVTMADYEALYAAEAQSLEYKEYNIARNLMRWQSLKGSLEERKRLKDRQEARLDDRPDDRLAARLAAKLDDAPDDMLEVGVYEI